MRFLVLGGTVFLSRAVAAAALAAGHTVTCVSRGVSGAPPDGAETVVADRSRPGSLAAALDGRTADAVVDVATMSAPWVRDALDALDGRYGHWTFVSSINAYADPAPRGGSVDQPVLAPLHDEPDPERSRTDPGIYGAAKVGSEYAVRERAGERAHVVRAGLMCGHGDLSDRYGYWANRFARGGRVVVPDVPAQPMQIVDVDDLAAWIVACAEDGVTGTHDGAGPRSTLDQVLAATAEAVGADDLELVRVPEEILRAQDIASWAGPRSLPLRLPQTLWGMVDRDVTATLAAGLEARPLAGTARAALAWERELGPDRGRAAGLTAAEERAVLAAYTTG